MGVHDLTDEPQERRRISGRRVLLVLLLAALTVPLLTWGTLRWVEHTLEQAEPLDWRQRAEWPTLPVRWVNEPHEEWEAAREAEAAEAMARLQSLAGADDFTEPHVADELATLAEHDGVAFYAHWLRGQWHRLSDEPEAAEAAWVKAFAAADGAIVLRYVDEAGVPVRGLELGPLVLEVAPGERLIYPALVTDRGGRVQVPVPGASKRVIQRPSVGPGLTTRDPWRAEWMRYPGRAGVLPPVVVQRR